MGLDLLTQIARYLSLQCKCLKHRQIRECITLRSMASTRRTKLGCFPSSGFRLMVEQSRSACCFLPGLAPFCILKFCPECSWAASEKRSWPFVSAASDCSYRLLDVPGEVLTILATSSCASCCKLCLAAEQTFDRNNISPTGSASGWPFVDVAVALSVTGSCTSSADLLFPL